MALVKEGRIVSDPYIDVSSAEELPPQGALLVSLEHWQNHWDRLQCRPEPVGILLESDQHPEIIADDLEQLSLIALRFPTFRDGRPYSYARLLRERYGFGGELRAVGDVLLEQLHFMQRCGFDAFEIDSDDPERDYAIAQGEFSVWYQPTGDGRPTAIQLRHARR
ncbi:MAG: DUF934 domain-containing protein [Gammaproteobacteria bacterium]|nr:MAG: DUF934 domain-containing protein [Gammaproteobacteria bacterium]